MRTPKRSTFGMLSMTLASPSIFIAYTLRKTKTSASVSLMFIALTLVFPWSALSSLFVASLTFGVIMGLLLIQISLELLQKFWRWKTSSATQSTSIQTAPLVSRSMIWCVVLARCIRQHGACLTMVVPFGILTAFTMKDISRFQRNLTQLLQTHLIISPALATSTTCMSCRLTFMSQSKSSMLRLPFVVAAPLP